MNFEYNFDEVIDRRNTDSVKYELLQTLYGTDDLLPMWVADMEFQTPACIIDALKRRCEHPVFGYTVCPKSFFELFRKWIATLHGWDVPLDAIGFVPGIVSAIALAVQAFTHPGDKIVVQPPVYPPFFTIPKANKREVVWNPLLEIDGRFEMNFDLLEKQVADKEVKMLILCNPHNPGGRVWNRETLQRLAAICFKNNILVVSDEIHADMVYPEYQHVPFASVSPEAQQCSITFMSPSKTFNMPGIICSYYVIENKDLYTNYKAACDALELHSNLFAIEAAQTAYMSGNEWRIQMIDYVRENVETVFRFCKEHIPQVRVMMPEASFLVWLDFKELRISDGALQRLIIDSAKLALNHGPAFGPGGEGHQRMNIGAPRSIVLTGLQQLEKAITCILK